jgi:hypothetical protein
VQGEVQRPTDGFRLGHAWLISDDDSRVYDPCLDKLFAAADYHSIFNASANLKCTPRQAAALSLADDRQRGLVVRWFGVAAAMWPAA